MSAWAWRYSSLPCIWPRWRRQHFEVYLASCISWYVVFLPLHAISRTSLTLGPPIAQAAISGILLVYGLGIVLSRQGLALVGTAIPACLAVGMVFVPYSPHWLLQRGRPSAALHALKTLRGPAYAAETELHLLEQALEAQRQHQSKPVHMLDLIQGGTGRAFRVAAAIIVLLQLCGITTIVTFTGAIFEAANYDNPRLGSVFTMFVNFFFTFVASFAVDRYGRRPLLLVSFIGASLSCTVLGVYFHLMDKGRRPPALLALLALICFNAFFALGLGPLPWLIVSEVLPARIRNLGSSSLVFLNWIMAFVIAQTFADMVHTLTAAGTFWFYAATIIPGVFYVVYVLPETKGRTLDDIEAEWLARPARVLPASSKLEATSARDVSGAVALGPAKTLRQRSRPVWRWNWRMLNPTATPGPAYDNIAEPAHMVPAASISPLETTV